MVLESKLMGLCINTDKTESQLIERNPGTCKTTLEGEVIKHLKLAIVSAPVLCYFDPQKPVTIQTDSFSSMPHLQRMLLKLLHFNLRVIFTPGKNMFIASRAYLKSKPSVAETEIADDIEVMVHLILHEFPASAEKLEEFRRETEADPDLFALKQYLREGVDQSLPTLKQYSRLLSNIYELDGMLFLNEHIIAPQSMHRSILMIIHGGHLGIEKCKTIALATTTIRVRFDFNSSSIRVPLDCDSSSILQPFDSI